MNSPNVEWFWGWVRRMGAACGGSVFPKRGYAASRTAYHFGYDWGQALCREQYGVDNSLWPDEPTDEDVARAKAWEEGDWPKWAVKPEETEGEAS